MAFGAVDTPLAPAQIIGAVDGRAGEVLTAEALDLLAQLHRKFDRRRLELLAARLARQTRFDAGERSNSSPLAPIT